MDKREALLQALLGVLETVPGAVLVERNRTSALPEESRPAIVLNDGDEEPVVEGKTWKPGHPLVSATIAVVDLYVSDSDENVGTSLNSFYRTVRRTVLSAHDATFKPIFGQNGSLTPGGLKPAFENGRRAEGIGRCEFRFTYPDNPLE